MIILLLNPAITTKIWISVEKRPVPIEGGKHAIRIKLIKRWASHMKTI